MQAVKFSCPCGTAGEVVWSENKILKCHNCGKPLMPKKSIEAPREKSADDLLSEILGVRQ